MRPHSRLARHQRRTAFQQTLLYVGLSVLFVIAVLKFGVPGFIQVVSWMMGKDAQKQSTDLSIPPQTPVLGDVPEATFSSKIKISGLAQAGLTVKLSVNGSEVDQVGTDSDGSFSFDKINLIDGVNQLTVVAVDSKNQESAPTNVSVTVNKDAPQIEITNPTDGSHISGINSQNISITGKVDQKGSDVRINGNYVSLDSEGNFEYRTHLNEGDNEFTVSATSTAGITAEKMIKVSFSL